MLWISGERFQRYDFGSRKLEWLSVTSSKFDDCSFKNLRVTGGALGEGSVQSVFSDCSFDGSHFSGVMLGYVRFENCSFRDVTAQSWMCHNVDFVDCVFTGRLDKLTVFGSYEGIVNEISGNDLTGATMLGGGFRAGVDLRKQKLPADKRHVLIPDPEAFLVRAMAAVQEWPDGEMRQFAASYLTVLGEDFRSGQNELLYCARDSSAAAAEANSRIRALIESGAK